MRVAVYVRVSTHDQSTEMQRRELEAYAKARGWEISGVFEDQATGTNANRPQLKAMMAAVRARQVDCVLCWKLDRVARSLKDLVNLIQEMQDYGVAFISFKDQLDLTSAAGRLMMHMIGAFAEFEADLIRSRVRAGLANARAKGQRLGRPLEIDAARVQELRRQGLSLGSIAQTLGVSKAGVHKTLRKTAA